MRRTSWFRIGSTALSMVFAMSVRADPGVPLPAGTYTFRHMDAEFPRSPGFPVKVRIRANRITVINEHPHRVLPTGVIDEATLMWHARSRQWILGHAKTDRTAAEVGGCSDGPDTIDFARRIIQTCEGGP